MLVLEIFRWWYGPGWLKIARNAGGQLQTLLDTFSVGILLRTLFAPWRRILTYPGAGLDAKMRAMLDNFVSRCVGFAVRITVLFVVAILTLLLVVFGIVQITLWPLVPILIPLSIVKGLL